MSLSTLLPYILVILAVILGDAICETPRNVSNPWQIRNDQTVYSQGVYQSSTTPWPSLGQRRSQLQNSFQQNSQQTNFQPSSNRQPTWVRQDNSPNWVRNTQIPNQPVTPNIQNYGNNNQNNGARWGSNQNQGSWNNQPVIVEQNPIKPWYGNGRNVYNPTTSTSAPGSFYGSRGNSQNQYQGQVQSGEVTDDELRQFSEELLSKDTNNAAKYVTINLQGMTSSRSSTDEAPEPLLTIKDDAYSIESISKLMQLYNNYIVEVTKNEVSTLEEKTEERNFLDTVISTPVMEHARNFLINKGKIGRDIQEFKDLLNVIWFNMYSRGKGKVGSSGFEHVFLSELKNGQVSGLHNWVYFNEEEKKRNANYLGYMKKIDLGNKGAILKYHFVFQNVDKPVGSMFIGTSPELEMALYSTCFILRADKICPLKMNNKRFIIRTYTYRYKGNNMIGSAFPEI